MEQHPILAQLPEQVMLQLWHQSPFAMMQGATEVLKRIRKIDENDKRSRETLVDTYKRARRRLIEMPDDQTLIFLHCGPSGSGKGRACQDMTSLLLQDMYLRQELDKKGVELELHTALFAHAMRAMQLPVFDAKGNKIKQIQVDPQNKPRRLLDLKAMGTLSQEDYVDASHFALNNIENEVIYKPLQHTRRVIVMEAGIITGFPYTNSEGNRGYYGYDRWTSVLDHLSQNPFTNQNLFVVGHDIDPLVFNEALRSRDPDNESKTREEETILVKKGDGLVEINSPQISAIEREQLLHLISISTNSYQGSIKSNGQITELIAEINKKEQKNIINNPQLYRLIRERLNIPDKRFIIASNQYLKEVNKIVDTRYLREHSLFVNLFPELLDPNIARA